MNTNKAPMPPKMPNPKVLFWRSIIISLVVLAAGILLTAAPTTAGTIIVYVLAACLAVAGIAQIVLKKVRGTSLFPIPDYASGLSAFALGAFLIAKPEILSSILSVVLAVFLIYAGFRMLEHAVDLLVIKARRWWIPLVFAAPVLFAGFFAMFYPLEEARARWIFLGIALIVTAVLDIAYFVMQRHADVVFNGAAQAAPQDARSEQQAPAAPQDVRPEQQGAPSFEQGGHPGPQGAPFGMPGQQPPQAQQPEGPDGHAE